MKTVTGTTEQVVRSLLTEPTGTHMLDSGGSNGRAWQRNQGRDFAAEPEVRVTVEYGCVDLTISTYHFLVGALDFAPELDARFLAWIDEPEQENDSWLALGEKFPEWLAEQGHDIRGGFYGDEDAENLVTINTYNHESLLDQVLQYTLFECDGDSYVALSVHGGADVRGGYTRPRIFRWNEDWSTSLLDDTRVYLSCDGQAPPQVETLDGFDPAETEYHRWETDGSYIRESGDGNGARDWEDYEGPTEIDSRESWIKGELCYLPDGTILCPECGAPVTAYLL